MYAEAPGQNQRQRRQLFSRQAFAACQRIVGTHEHTPFFPSGKANVIIFIHIDGFQQQSHIDEALVHLLFHNVGIGRQQIERNQWILRMKNLTAPGQYRAGREFAASDADAALQRFVLTYEFLLGFIGQGHQFFRAAAQQRAFVGQGNFPCSPLHELYAQFLLQHGQLAGQGWLRNMQHFRRTGNVLLPNDGQKITKNTKLHPLPPLSSYLR